MANKNKQFESFMRTATQEESELIQSTFGEFEAMIRGRLHGYIAHTVIAAIATALFILAVSSVAAAFSSDIAERFSIIPTTFCLAASHSCA